MSSRKAEPSRGFRIPSLLVVCRSNVPEPLRTTFCHRASGVKFRWGGFGGIKLRGAICPPSPHGDFRAHITTPDALDAVQEQFQDSTMTVSTEPHDVDSQMLFISRDSKINRRYISPGLEVNTGKYEAHKVHIRDARPRRGQCSLETTGFQLSDHKSAVNSPVLRLSTDSR